MTAKAALTVLPRQFGGHGAGCIAAQLGHADHRFAAI
jgi:hypothetical protein